MSIPRLFRARLTQLLVSLLICYCFCPVLVSCYYVQEGTREPSQAGTASSAPTTTQPLLAQASQLLDCDTQTTTQAIASSNSNLDGTTHRPNGPCEFTSSQTKSNLSSSSSHSQETSANPSQYSNVALESATTTTTTPSSRLISIEFNNIVRRQANNLDNNPAGINCSTNSNQSDQTTKNGSFQFADFICLPKANYTQQQQQLLSFGSNRRDKLHGRQIQVYIVPTSDSADADDTIRGSQSRRIVQLGTTNIVQCRLNISAPPAGVQDHSNYELKFKFRWLRSSVSPNGFRNQSISPNESSSSSSSSSDGAGRQAPAEQVIISTDNRRMWTVQREGGLDLFLTDFKPTDLGDYFCQAVLMDTPQQEGSSKGTGDDQVNSAMIVLDEKRIQLVTSDNFDGDDDDGGNGNTIDSDGQEAGQGARLNSEANLYSQENLRKLLPSLQVVPEYSEVARGATIQLACITGQQDPDPSPDQIEWTYEPFERPGFTLGGGGAPSGDGGSQALAAAMRGNGNLPPDTQQVGNVLIVWSMSYESVGIYKCTVHLKEFNLTSDASGELVLRPALDSAPIVYITPELLRLSANGSATIQCESTGYPPPKIEWYRVEVPTTSGGGGGSFGTKLAEEQEPSTSRNRSSFGGSSSSGSNNNSLPGTSLDRLEGLELKYLGSRDSMSHCEQVGCLAINKHRQLLGQGKAAGQQPLITGLSLVHIQQARAHHQGQYVCMASNKHGQNQASTLVDVEFKERPRVRVADESRQQTIVLDHDELLNPTTGLESSSYSSSPSRPLMYNATFRCSIEAGQPQPRLKWLRLSPQVASANGATARASNLATNPRFLMNKIESTQGVFAMTDNMDIYDLTRMSSATAKVTISYENQGRVLVLHLSTISVDDEGDYVCVGENELGRHSDVAHLIVQRPAQVRILQSSPRIFRANESFQLDCLASGHPAPLDIEWSRSDRGAFFALISRSASGGSRQERAVLKFDRVTPDDAGEYTCAARDPLSSSNVLRDTIMLLYEDETSATAGGGGGGLGESIAANNLSHVLLQRQLPKLLIRPTKVIAELGSNITLDCLAISGLQPTIVEWLAPATIMSRPQDHSHQHQHQRQAELMDAATAIQESVLIEPYYRSRAIVSMSSLMIEDEASVRRPADEIGGNNNKAGRQLLQFGSKLRIFNVSKAHEGVYQCKGRNKVGVENAPALIRVVDAGSGLDFGARPSLGLGQGATGLDGHLSASKATFTGTGGQQQQQEALHPKTKIAKMGSNIELRCQVNGKSGEQSATSWSREGRELPNGSVQIGHNLWLQNLTKADEGLYLCSARSSEPNQVIQAQINLLVSQQDKFQLHQQQHQFGATTRYDPATLSAKIVASKSTVNVGDSLTLECIIKFTGQSQFQQQQQHNQSMLLKDSDSGGDDELLGRTGTIGFAQSSPVSQFWPDLDELERQVVWTNLHSGQTLFQDNVYILNNLLIIYDLKVENSATYRCNYNELSQHIDYELQVGESPLASDLATISPTKTSATGSISTSFASHDEQMPSFASDKNDQQPSRALPVKQIELPLGSRLVLQCSPNDTSGFRYFWTRSNNVAILGGSANETKHPIRRVGRDTEPLVMESLDTSDADLYQCHRQAQSEHSNANATRIVDQYLVQVRVVSAKFNQRPVSFISLPAKSDAYNQLELEMKFYPENEHGLLLFSGGALGSGDLSLATFATSTTNQQQNKSIAPNVVELANSLVSSPDYISLGLKAGHLEFKFELGDGATMLRSLQPLAVNQWHRVLIERNRRVAIMWLDGLAPISNNSAGKFFNLNLDSLLYVGGHQRFLSLGHSSFNSKSNRTGPQQATFYGFEHGFQGCISSLRFNRHELDLMARNRSVSMGIFECDKSECQANGADAATSGASSRWCSPPNGHCQVDRSGWSVRRSLELATDQRQQLMAIKRRQSLASADLRCICSPATQGASCNESMTSDQLASLAQYADSLAANEQSTPTAAAGQPDHHTIKEPPRQSSSPVQSTCDSSIALAASTSKRCNATGTVQCQLLSSSSFRCHCKLGYAGELCDQTVTFTNETAVWFGQQAFVQFAFNSAADVVKSIASQQRDQLPPITTFNETEYSRLTTFTDQLNVSLRLQTRSSYGLLFYTGQSFQQVGGGDETNDQRSSRSGSTITSGRGNQTGATANRGSRQQHQQVSKSVAANLLARLASLAGSRGGAKSGANSSSKAGADYLAIALVDGHVELSYELGSGVAIVRSTKRINDGLWHKIEVFRSGKVSSLIIDAQHRYEGQSPGKLFALNAPADIYLGGLPILHWQQAVANSGWLLLSTFTGHLSSVHINSLGPVNLISDDHLTQVRFVRNLLPWRHYDQLPVATAGQAVMDPNENESSTPITLTTATASSQTLARPTGLTSTVLKKPPRPTYSPESESDDPDELARA